MHVHGQSTCCRPGLFIKVAIAPWKKCVGEAAINNLRQKVDTKKEALLLLSDDQVDIAVGLAWSCYTHLTKEAVQQSADLISKAC